MHFGLVLDQQLNFIDHIQNKTTKCYKIIAIIKKLSVNRPRDALLRVYKSFIRPHLDYGNIIYDKPKNEPFKSKIENIQYKTCIAITGAIQGTCREPLVLGLESLESRHWYPKLMSFDKIVNGATPRYLTSYLNTNENPVYNTRVPDQNKIRRFRARTEHFKQLFFPFCVNEWYKLD